MGKVLQVNNHGRIWTKWVPVCVTPHGKTDIHYFYRPIILFESILVPSPKNHATMTAISRFLGRLSRYLLWNLDSLRHRIWTKWVPVCVTPHGKTDIHYFYRPIILFESILVPSPKNHATMTAISRFLGRLSRYLLWNLDSLRHRPCTYTSHM